MTIRRLCRKIGFVFSNGILRFIFTAGTML